MFGSSGRVQLTEPSRVPWRTPVRQLPLKASAEVQGGDQDRACKRRKLLIDAAGLAATDTLLRSREAWATRMMPNRHGELYEAFDFDIPLRVVALSGSIPTDWEQDFKSLMQGRAKLQIDRRGQITDVYDELRNPGKKNTAALADAVTLGDAFLAPAIKEGLIQPLQGAFEQPWWDSLSPRWQRLVQRDEEGRVSSKGQAWAVPYRWGCTLIAWNPGKLKSRKGNWPIKDWTDLLQPALKGRLGFVDSPRDFVGVVMKTLGLSFNATASDAQRCAISKQTVLDRAAQLRRQILQVSSREQQQALQSGDLWAAVGPSSSLVPLAMRQNKIDLVAPASGTSLWSHLWVVPRNPRMSLPSAQQKAGPSPLLPAWLSFPLEPQRASRRKGLQGGASPLLLPGLQSRPQCHARADSGSQLATSSALDIDPGNLMPSDEVLRKSEFLEPLDADTRDLYRDILASI